MNDGNAPTGPVRDPKLLREYAGRRERTIDEQMFTVDRSTFRLQIFTAPGMRPVVLATQTDREGAVLMNRAERFVEAIWRRHCPEQAQPPVFIAHQLLNGKDLGFHHYGFTATGPYIVSEPAWGPRLREPEMQELVGGPVDASRGDDYVEPPQPKDPQVRYAVAALTDLPQPDLAGEPPCMPSTPSFWHRVTGRRTAACCSYHAADWGTASQAALAALARASYSPTGDPHDDEGETDRMLKILETVSAELGLDDMTRHAAASLFMDPIQPVDDDEWGYINGRHRAQAMLDTAVPSTVVAYWDDPED